MSTSVVHVWIRSTEWIQHLAVHAFPDIIWTALIADRMIAFLPLQVPDALHVYLNRLVNPIPHVQLVMRDIICKERIV